MNLGKTIFRLRTQQKMSQEELAAALGVSRQSVSKWENGNATPDLDKLVKMSNLFSVTLDELVGKEPPGSTAPQPGPPSPSSSINTGDLVCILILLFGVLIPILIIATSSIHNSSLLMALALFLIPPLATICAAFSAPHNKVLYRVYLVYNILFGIAAAYAGNVLAPFIIILYVFAVAFWNDRLD